MNSTLSGDIAIYNARIGGTTFVTEKSRVAPIWDTNLSVTLYARENVRYRGQEGLLM